MSLWNGEGAALVLAKDGDAILLERAEGGRSLAKLASNGKDDEASRIICGVVAKLHALRIEPFNGLFPLPQWFRELEPAAARFGGILLKSAATAHDLLATHETWWCSTATFITTTFWILAIVLGLQSILKDSSVNAVSIMRIFFAIPMR